MKLLEEMSELYRKGISIELSGETPTYAMVEMRGAHSIMRLVPKDISEDSLINYIENDLVREVEKRDLFF